MKSTDSVDYLLLVPQYAVDKSIAIKYMILKQFIIYRKAFSTGCEIYIFISI